MYPPKFNYFRAGSVDEALTLLQENQGAKLLAGGHSLLPIMKLRLVDPGTVIDIGRIDELKGISTARRPHAHRCLDTACLAGEVERVAPGLGRGGRDDRRPDGTQSRHHRWQYRPC